VFSLSDTQDEIRSGLIIFELGRHLPCRVACRAVCWRRGWTLCRGMCVGDTQQLTRASKQGRLQLVRLPCQSFIKERRQGGALGVTLGLDNL